MEDLIIDIFVKIGIVITIILFYVVLAIGIIAFLYKINSRRSVNADKSQSR